MLQRLQSSLLIGFINTIAFLFKRLSLSTCWSIGSFLGRVVHHLMPSRRAIVRKNLQILAAYQQQEKPVDDAAIKSIICRSSANLACSLKAYTMDADELRSCVTLSCDPSFTRHLTEGSGVILCLAHMGNWEILTKMGLLLPDVKAPFGAVYRPLKNTTVDEYVRGERQKHGCQMFSKYSSLNTIAEFVRNGGALGIVADQRAGGKKSERPFLGAVTPRSKLPAVLAKRTQAPLFGCSVSSPAPHKWHLEISLISDEIETSSSDELTELVTRFYETKFMQHPLDVFWLHDYWKDFVV